METKKNSLGYEAPRTTLLKVRVESGLCAASDKIHDPIDKNKDNNHVTINPQETQTIDLSNDTWE